MTIVMTLASWLATARSTPEMLFAREIRDLLEKAEGPTGGALETQVKDRMANPPADLGAILHSTLQGQKRPTWHLTEALIQAAIDNAQAQCVALPANVTNVPLWRQRYDDLFVRPGRWRPGIVLIAAGVTVIALFSYTLGAAGQQAVAKSPTVPSTGPTTTTTAEAVHASTAPPSTPSARIKIDRIRNPPLCATFTGVGVPPTGETSWLVVRSDEPRYYFYAATLVSGSDRWVAKNVTLGVPEEPPGEPFDIFATVMTADATKAITPEVIQNGLVALPSGVRVVDEYQVERGAGRRECD
jgi:hypothetical protein